MSESTAKEESTQNEKGQSSGGDAKIIEATSGRMSFAQFKALKEEDRTKHFTKKNEKRLKLETKGKASSKVSTCKIQIGIMINKDGGLRVKRGNNTTLPLTVAADISYDELLTKAAEKHHRFNKDVIKNKEKEFYCLLYSDKTKAEFLPGSDERFNLEKYKEEIGKPYSKIVLYLCRWAEYYSAHVDELGFSSGNENSDESVEEQLQHKDSSKTVSAISLYF